MRYISDRSDRYGYCNPYITAFWELQQYNPVPETQPAPVETTPAPVAQNNDIPTTGASDVIFSAIMLGVVASLAVYNIQLVKERQ